MTSDMKLLIVDDDEDLLRQLKFLLEDDFASVQIFGSKSIAQEMNPEKIDIFLIDVSVTDDMNTDNLTLAKTLYKQNNPPLIIIMSCYDECYFAELSQQMAHGVGFIRKPFKMDEFIQKVREIKEKSAIPILG